MTTPIRVLCVDDHAFLAEGLQTRLSMERGLEFVGWLGSAEGLHEKLRETGAHVVLLDIEMPGPDPFVVVDDLRRQFPQVRVIILSAFVRDHYLDSALKAGAWGYVSKSDEPQTVIDAIRSVVKDQFAFGPTVLERCRPSGETGAAGGRPASKLDRLTPREVEILRLIGKGMSRDQIARSIHRSPKTVDNHRAAIMEKLGINDRVELARYAIGEGMAEL